ncbi:helix-turn-helix domain-containing protein [Bacillus infantis]|uniref:Helix-turn-helix domain-containing protein n=1 Tax=Bacillus infantis TaxID=324767 RepID=A0A5D4S8B7_9BACI|nr:helix-turn-helix domain-containing protein [Bacillus infantis]TYS57896.1 helix-turn-helix domain-containing protein [Bacillus infantis]
MKEGYGDFIRRNRIASGYTRQKELAEVSGISPATISRIEKEVQKPGVETLKELSKHLSSTSLKALLISCGYFEALEIEDSEDKHYINYHIEDRLLNVRLKSILETLSDKGQFKEEVKLDIFSMFEGNMIQWNSTDLFDDYYKVYLLTKEEEPDYYDEELEDEFKDYYNCENVYESVIKSTNHEWKELILSQLLELADRHNLKITQQTEMVDLSIVLNEPNLVYNGHQLTTQEVDMVKHILNAFVASKE